MKKLVFIFSLLLCMAAGSVNAGAQKLVAEKDAKKDLWGYKAPRSDKWVVKPKYSEVMPFVKVKGAEVAFAKAGDVWEEVDATGKVLQKFTDVKPYADSSLFIFAKQGTGDYSWGYIGTGDYLPSSEKFNYYKDFKMLSPFIFIAYLKNPDPYYGGNLLRKLITPTDSGFMELSVDECGDGYVAKTKDGINQIYDDQGALVAQFPGELKFLREYNFPLVREGIYGPWTLYYITPDQKVIKLCKEYFSGVKALGDNYVIYFEGPDSDCRGTNPPFVIDRNGNKILTADVVKCELSSDDGKLIVAKKVDGFGRRLTNGVAIYTKDGKKQFDGSKVDIITGPEGTYYAVTTNGKVGIVNGDLEWIVPQGKYTKYEEAKNGYRFFTADNKEEMADKHFKIDAAATAANSNTARVTYKNGKWAFTKNGVPVTAWYDDFNGATSASYSGYVTDVFGRNPNSGDEIIMVAKNGKYGLLNTKTLKEVVPCVYDKIGSRAYGRIRVKKAGLCGFLDGYNFQVVVPCKYISVDNFMERAQMSQNPFALVVIASDGGRYKIGYINKSGQVFETQYAPKKRIVIW